MLPEFDLTIYRKPRVMKMLGVESPETLRKMGLEGRWPPPVSLGGRGKGWPAFECNSIIQAFIAGRTPEEVKELVAALVAGRQDGYKAFRPKGSEAA